MYYIATATIIITVDSIVNTLIEHSAPNKIKFGGRRINNSSKILTLGTII